MIYDVIIIGGGAAGMTAAIHAAKKLKENNPAILLIEKNKKLGKKLYATGNGKCNLANAVLDLSCYDSSQEFFPYEVIDVHSCQLVCDFMRELGISVTDKNGYMYPSSMQASSVVWALTDKLKSFNIMIHLKEEYISGDMTHGFYIVKTNMDTYITKNLILTPGGAAAPQLGGTDKNYHSSVCLGLKMHQPYPALCKLITEEDIRMLSGVRVKAEAVLYADDRAYAEESGELQFTPDGLSGIMIFNLSIGAGKLLEDGMKLDIKVSLLPEKTEKEINDFIVFAGKTCPERKIQGVLNGLLNEKLVEYIINQCEISPSVMSALNNDDINRLSHEIKNLKFRINGYGSFSEAQVTSGGIDTSCINPVNCEVYAHRGLFVAGEYLDVTGKCGGYNIMWAVITGMKAGNGVRYDTNQ